MSVHLFGTQAEVGNAACDGEAHGGSERDTRPHKSVADLPHH